MIAPKCNEKEEEKKKKVFDNSLNRDQSVKVYSATTTVNQNEAAADELFLKLFNHFLLTIPVPLQFVVVVFFNIYLLAIKELCNIKKKGLVYRWRKRRGEA